MPTPRQKAMAAAYRGGLSARGVAARFGCHERTVRRALAACGARPRGVGRPGPSAAAAKARAGKILADWLRHRGSVRATARRCRVRWAAAAAVLRAWKLVP